MQLAFKRAGAVFLLASVAATSRAQQQVPLTPQELAIKSQVEKLSPQSPIHLKLRQGPEQFGNFVSNDQQNLTIYNIYLNHNVTIAYVDVKTIKNGLGSYDPNTGKSKSHKKAIVITVTLVIAVIGGFGASFRR